MYLVGAVSYLLLARLTAVTPLFVQLLFQVARAQCCESALLSMPWSSPLQSGFTENPRGSPLENCLGANLPGNGDHFRQPSQPLVQSSKLLTPPRNLGFYRVGPQPLNHASVDSYTVKPAKQFLHSIRKNNYSSDSPEESAGIICICVKKFFNHTKAC